MRRERSWMWTYVWCLACWAFIAGAAMYRHEPRWMVLTALANVIFFAVQIERWRRESNQAQWVVMGDAGLELEAKNEAQAKMIADYIALIEAAKEIGVYFHWENREHRIAKAEFRPQKPETWPQHCDLCNHDMESETDRTEWHGLGNCVPICPTCCGSGTADEIARMLPPETVFEAARQLIQKRAELIELEKRIDKHDHEEFSTCGECDSWPVKNAEYKQFCEQWAHQFALFAGGMRTRPKPIECSLCGDNKEIAVGGDGVMACPACQKCKYGCTREQYCVSCNLHRPRKRTAEGGCATQA